MTTLHLVTTVYVGGQTGKSTFSLMLAAYLCSTEHQPSFVILIDASHNATLYENFHQIFNQLSPINLGGHEGFLVSNEQGTNHLIVVKPKANVSIANPEAVIVFVTSVQQAVQARFQPDPAALHIICESNLPQSEGAATDFLKNLRGGHKSSTFLYLWSTLNTLGLTEPSVYSQHYSFEQDLGEKAALMYVHNPYTQDGLQMKSKSARNISESMKRCYDLALTDYNVEAGDLWANCGEPASLIINDPNFENIWLAAYDGFIKLNVRPRNILPVFRYSEGWRTAVVSRFASNRISRPHELAESLDKTSDRLYSDVFELYFQNLNL